MGKDPTYTFIALQGRAADQRTFSSWNQPSLGLARSWHMGACRMRSSMKGIVAGYPMCPALGGAGGLVWLLHLECPHHEQRSSEDGIKEAILIVWNQGARWNASRLGEPRTPCTRVRALPPWLVGPFWYNENNLGVVTFNLVHDLIYHVEVGQNVGDSLTPILRHGVHCLRIGGVKQRVKPVDGGIVLACKAIDIPWAECASHPIEPTRMKTEIHTINELTQVISILHLVATHPTKMYDCTFIRSSGKQIKEDFSEKQEARICIDRLTAAVVEDVLTTQGIANDFYDLAVHTMALAKCAIGIPISRQLPQSRRSCCFVL